MDTDVASFLPDSISDKPPANIFSDGGLSDDDDDSDLIGLPWSDTPTGSDLTGTSLSLAGLNDDLIFSIANNSIPETFPVVSAAPPELPMHSSDIMEHVVKVTDGIQASRDYVTIPVRERTTTEESDVKLEDFGLDESFFEGIAAKDMNSLLEQFEEAAGDEAVEPPINVEVEPPAKPQTAQSSGTSTKRTYGIASKGKLIPRSGQSTPSMPCSPVGFSSSESSSSSSSSSSESESEDEKAGEESEVMKLLTSKQPVTPTKTPVKAQRQSLSAPNSPPHAPSQEVIRKIQNSTKQRSAVLLTNAVPAKGERGGRAVALTSAAMPAKLQRILSQHEGGTQSAPTSPTHTRQQASPQKSASPAKSSSKQSAKDQHQVSSDYYSLIIDHDYCVNFPVPAPVKEGEQKQVSIMPKSLLVPIDNKSTESSVRSPEEGAAIEKPKNKISVKDYLNKLKAGEVKRPPRPKPPEHNPMVLPPGQMPGSDSLNDKDGSVLKGMLLQQNLQEELKRRAAAEQVKRERKSSVNLDVVGMELENSDEETKKEKPRNKPEHSERRRHPDPLRTGTIPRRKPGSSSHRDRDITRRSPLENLHPTRPRDEKSHNRYSAPTHRRSRSPPPKISKCSPPHHTGAPVEPPRVPPQHNSYNMPPQMPVGGSSAHPPVMPVGDVHTGPVLGKPPVPMIPPINVPPPQVVANIPPPNMQHGLHIPHVMPPPPCLPPPPPSMQHLPPPMNIPAGVVPPGYPHLPAPAPVYNQMSATPAMLPPDSHLMNVSSVASNVEPVHQSNSPYVSPHNSRSASPEPAPPGVEPVTSLVIAPVSTATAPDEYVMEESESEDEMLTEPPKQEENVVIKHESPVAKNRPSVGVSGQGRMDVTADTTVHDMSVSMDEDDVDIEGLNDEPMPLVEQQTSASSPVNSLLSQVEGEKDDSVAGAADQEDDVDITSIADQSPPPAASVSPHEQETAALVTSPTSDGCGSKDINQNKTDQKSGRVSRVAHRNYRKRGPIPQTKDAAYIDKLPSYLNPLSAASKVPQKTQKDATNNLKSVVMTPAGKAGPFIPRNDERFNKLPDYLSCLTNSAKVDGINESAMEQESPASSRSQSPNLVIASRANSTSRPTSRAVSPAGSVSRTKISPIRYTSNKEKSRSRSKSPVYSRKHRSISRSRSRSRSFHRRGSFDNRRRRKRRSYSSSRSSSRSASGSRSRSRSRSRSGRRKRSWVRSRSRSHSRSRSRSVVGRYRAQSRRRSQSMSRSRSRSGSRSRSIHRDRARRGERTRGHFSRSKSPRESSSKDLVRWDMSKKRQIEERRIVYVGRIPEGTTRRDLVNKFERFGDIVNVSVHFRDEGGDNYGFVTFQYTCDAFAAIDKGNTIPGMEDYDLCFGGRREFCKSEYEDLDGNAEDEEELGPPTAKPAAMLDFDELLKQAMRKSKC